MAESERRGILTIGVFLIVVAVAIILYVPLGLIDWTLIPPSVLVLFGCWIIVLAGMRASNPQKYERPPFSTLSWGLLLVALGAAWFVYYISWLYSLMIILLVFAVIAIVTALKRK
jgi:hypothetical protein